MDAVAFISGFVLGGLLIAFLFIFVGIKSNKELERELDQKDIKIYSLESDLKMYDLKLDAILKTDEAFPPECKEGPWCDACGFVKYYHIPYHGKYQPVRCCGKGESCKHFVQKERKDV